MNKAKRLEGEPGMSAPHFFQSAGQEDLQFWRENDGRIMDLLMMMIAFITIKSRLVPLIEGLCAQI